MKHVVDHSWETVQKEKPDLIHLLDFPYNGETRPDQLLEGKITDNKYHLYVLRAWLFCSVRAANCFPISVRNHGGVPDIDEDLFRLEIGGLVKSPVSLSLKDLKDPKKFPCVIWRYPLDL